MEENYISIFCLFLSNLVKEKRMVVPDAIFLMREFEPVCAKIKSRQDLLSFIEPFCEKSSDLQVLKKQLLDSNHIFN